MSMNGDVLTNEVRFSFVHLLRPYQQNEKDEPKYSVTILVPKTDTATVQEIQRAIQWATQQGVEKKWGGVRPAIVTSPIWDGDGVRQNGEAFGPECKGHWVFTASVKAEKGAPEIVDTTGAHITGESQIYSGMYGRAFVQFFPYNYGGKKGVGCSLGPIQKTRDGDALSGHTPSAASVFGAPAGSAASVFGQQPAPMAQPQPAVPFGQPAPAVPLGQPLPAVHFGQPAPAAPAPAGFDDLTGLPFGG